MRGIFLAQACAVAAADQKQVNPLYLENLVFASIYYIVYINILAVGLATPMYRLP